MKPRSLSWVWGFARSFYHRTLECIPGLLSGQLDSTRAHNDFVKQSCDPGNFEWVRGFSRSFFKFQGLWTHLRACLRINRIPQKMFFVKQTLELGSFRRIWKLSDAFQGFFGSQSDSARTFFDFRKTGFETEKLQADLRFGRSLKTVECIPLLFLGSAGFYQSSSLLNTFQGQLDSARVLNEFEQTLEPGSSRQIEDLTRRFLKIRGYWMHLRAFLGVCRILPKILINFVKHTSEPGSSR